MNDKIKNLLYHIYQEVESETSVTEYTNDYVIFEIYNIFESNTISNYDLEDIKKVLDFYFEKYEYDIIIDIGGVMKLIIEGHWMKK